MDARIKKNGEPGRPRISTQIYRSRAAGLIPVTTLDAEHAAALGLSTITPGAVRSNIETTGINLIALLGRDIEVGEAVLRLYEPRDPCAKMDAICQGLRARMMNQRQGVLAEVVRGGKVCVGDAILMRDT